MVQKLRNSLEEKFISLYLLDDLSEEDRIFQGHQFLQDNKCTKGIQDSFANISELKHDDGEVLQ